MLWGGVPVVADPPHPTLCSQELFRPFGHVPRIYLAVDRVTGESRGFAFITFAHRWGVGDWGVGGD